MKKIIIALVLVTVISYAQNKMYIVFTNKTESQLQGFNKSQVSSTDTALFDAKEENYPSISFLMIRHINNNDNNYYNHYIEHESLKSDSSPLRIYKKPLSWLSTIDYVDWDAVGAGKT